MIRDYQTGDALMIVPQSIQAGEAQIFAEGFEYITSYSLEDEQGGILAVCGFDVFEFHGEQVAQCYALIGQNVGAKLNELTHFLEKKIPEQAYRLGIKRVFMTVRDDFSQAKRFATLLGFKPIRVLANFFAGKTYQLYERKFYYGSSGSLN